MKRRSFLKWVGAGAMAAGAGLPPICAWGASRPIRIGIALPLSGPQAPLGHSLRGAAGLAIEEIDLALRAHPNRWANGIRAAVVDTGATRKSFSRALRHLATRHPIASIFGLCPAGLRTELHAFLEHHDTLFWDPAPTEGGECSDKIIHGGPTPYQSLGHLVPWMAEKVGGRFLLLGTDQPWPAELVRVGREMVKETGATPVGPDELFPPGHRDFSDVLDTLTRDRVDVVISALTDDSAVAFFRQYHAAGIDPRQTPVASPTLTEFIVHAATPPVVAGAIAVSPYFADGISPANVSFVHHLRRRAGSRAHPNAVAEAMWFQLRQFAAAAAKLGFREVIPANIREAAKGCQVAAPEGEVEIEPDTLYTRLWPKIAVVDATGRFQVLARTEEPVRPLPFWGWPGRSCVDSAVVER